MENIKELFELINEKKQCMSKGQKKISNYIQMNFDSAVFMTAATLGEKTGVSESTVVRYTSVLGFKGYPDFQKSLQQLVQNKLNTIHRVRLDDLNMSKADIVKTVMLSDIDRIKLSMEMLDSEVFEEAIENILSAERIYITGIRNCSPLASFMGFYLNMMFDNVKVITTNSSSEIFEQIIDISDKDVMIGISFPRYSMRTLKAMELSNNRNAKVIAITDGENSPMNLYSSCNLFARSELTNVMDSLTAAMSLINSLLVAVSVRRKENVINRLDMLEELWNDYQVYGNDEINMFDDSGIELESGKGILE